MEGKKILIVDDNGDFADVLKARLGNPSPANITTATTDDAIAQISTSTPDVVVLDLLYQEGARGNALEKALLNDGRLAQSCVVTLTPVERQAKFRMAKGLPTHVVITPRHPKTQKVEDFVREPSPFGNLLQTVKSLMKAGAGA